jgi:hypothetical protein
VAATATIGGPAIAAVYTLEDGGSAMFGREERVTTVHEDTLYDIARQHGLPYGRLIAGLKAAGVEVDRKVLADLAVREPAAFAAMVDTAKASFTT